MPSWIGMGLAVSSGAPVSLIMDTFLHDIRYALRLLRKNPAFTAVVVLTVALGVGANTAVFSVVYAALLRDHPYPDADRLVVARDLAPGALLEWRREAASFSAMSAYEVWDLDVTGRERPERVTGAVVNGTFFDVLQVPPALGRPLTPSDEGSNSLVAVLSDAYWRRSLGSDPEVVGARLTINGRAYTVVGVMPPSFALPESTSIWIPPRRFVPEHPLRPQEDASHNYGSHYLGMYARLKPVVSMQSAQAEQRTIFKRLLGRHPDDMEPADADVTLIALREWLVGDIEPALLALFAAVIFVLLIGCANVASLMLARSAARAQEINVRAALCAPRLRIVRLLLAESVLLATLGGAAGVLCASWITPLLTSMSPPSVRDVHAGITGPVMLFALGLSLFTGVLFGCAPAWQSVAGITLSNSLRQAGRATDSRQGRRARHTLIVLELAISMALLVTAGLLIRSVAAIRHVDPGFDASGLYTARVVLPADRYQAAAQQAHFFDHLLDGMRAAPGLERTAAAARLPFVGGESTRGITVDHPSPVSSPWAGIRVVSPGYFAVMGQGIREGRGLTDRDREGSPPVALVNETMAREYWPGQSAVGHRFRIGDGHWMEIVGVAADVKHASLRDPIEPEFYQPYAQAPWTFMSIVVRSTAPQRSIERAIEQQLAALDPALPAPPVQPMTALIGHSFAMDRFEMAGLTIFAAIALTLAAVGLYGVMSFLVSRRTREIGVRIALGAGVREILALVMRDGLRLTILGAVLGLASALVGANIIRSWLFGVVPADPVTFVSVLLVLASVSLLATYVPARRAAAIDPTIALRSE
jgi:putative ABC transport system permease protein